MREEVLELRVKLRRQRLVVAHDQRRLAVVADQVRHRERLPGPRHAQQRLMPVPRLQRLRQLRNRLRLVALRLVVTLKSERHRGGVINQIRRTAKFISPPWSAMAGRQRRHRRGCFISLANGLAGRRCAFLFIQSGLAPPPQHPGLFPHDSLVMESPWSHLPRSGIFRSTRSSG